MTEGTQSHNIEIWRSRLSLLPLVLFMVFYLGGSLWAGDFYKIPMTVAFLVSSAVALMVSRGKLPKRINKFSAGASDKNIMLMVWIYIMAGAFAKVASDMGAVESTVSMALNILPATLIYVGIFVASAFVSLSIGTSVGTIVALVPIAVGIATQTGDSPAMLAAVVVGGSYFGDNLSFISDTTIAATQTQGCRMDDKFRMNLRMIWPAVVAMIAIYIFRGMGYIGETAPQAIAPSGATTHVAVIPYVAVIGLSLLGVNVLVVLSVGLALAGAIGMLMGKLTIWSFLSSMQAGIESMGGLIVVAILAGGMLEVIRANGGIRLIVNSMQRRVRTERGAEVFIGATVAAVNLCTANNTVAIITVGRIARDVATRFGVAPRRVASLLDSCACCAQGLLPYGVQMLLASQFASCSPLDILPHLYYPVFVGVCVIGSIMRPSKNPRN